MDRKLIEKARAFAMQMHSGQIRPNATRSPYLEHPMEVAELVEKSGGSVEEIVAALLHDTVEDTATTIEMIEELFGSVVAQIVGGLTDKPELKGIPTLTRKMLQAERVRHKSKSVKRVKLADQTSNIRAISIDPPTEWNMQKCTNYIKGAAHIAQECKGISPFLDREFEEAYKKASAVYPQ